MEEIPWEKRFHFRDGTAAKDTQELKTKIESLSYEEFYRHVNSEKNDFANWIEHVLDRKALADRLRAVDSIVETVELLSEDIAPYQTYNEDLQVKIEEQLFSAPPAMVEEEVPEITFESLPVEEPTAELQLPTQEETEFSNRVPGAPVTTHEPSHVSIKELSERHAAKHSEEHMRFLVLQFVYGFVFGVVVGLILGRIISILVAS